MEEKQLRRAGLDYRELMAVKIWKDWTKFSKNTSSRVLSFSTKNSRSYTDFSFEPGDMLLFGSETSGLPLEIHQQIEPANALTIPMRSGNRSLNLSNSVAIAVFEAWRQQGFFGAKKAQ